MLFTLELDPHTTYTLGFRWLLKAENYHASL